MKRSLRVSDDEDDDKREGEVRAGSMSGKPKLEVDATGQRKLFPSCLFSPSSLKPESVPDSSSSAAPVLKPQATPKRPSKKREAPPLEDDERPSGKAMVRKKIRTVSASPVKERKVQVQKPKPEKDENSQPNSALDGVRVVFTGVMEVIERSAIETKTRMAGGHVSSAVSGLTEYLVHGNILEDGRPYDEGSKYRKAQELIKTGKTKKNLQILTEEQFLLQFPEIRPENEIGSGPSGLPSPTPMENQAPQQKPRTSLGAKPSWAKPGSRKEIETKNVKVEQTAELLEQSASEREKLKSQVWVERWRPHTFEGLAFNQECCKALDSWLVHWDAGDVSDKGALLCGPPGVGKTSCVHIIAKANNYNLLEFNASDTRSKKALDKLQDLATGARTLFQGEVQERCLVLMDEADGLSTGDRGGSAAIAKLIQISKIPIICAANDRSHPKVKTIAKQCKVIDFARPTRLAAVNRCLQIWKREGFVTDARPYVEQLFDATNGDIRQMLNTLEMKSASLNAEGSGRAGNLMLKDIGAFDEPTAAVRRLFADRHLDTNKRMDVFFLDYDFVPLYVHENYAKLAMAQKSAVSMKTVADVADSIALGDILNNKMRAAGNWSLLPDVGYLSTAFPTATVGGTMWRLDFPQVLPRMSTTRKNKRLLSELSSHLGVSGQTCLVDGYYDLLASELGSPLLNEHLDPKERASEFLDNLDCLGLTRDMFVENLMCLRISGETALYDKCDTRTKTAVTREVNARLKRSFTSSTNKTAGSAATRASPSSLSPPGKTGGRAKAKAKGKAKAGPKMPAISEKSPERDDGGISEVSGDEEDARNDELAEEEAKMNLI